MPVENIANICYKLIKENNNLFLNLKDYDKDYSQNKEKIKKFVESRVCCNKYYNFIKLMLETTQYISCDEFISIIDHNLRGIKDIIRNNKYYPILITTKSEFTKSNIFYALYFLARLNNKYDITINHIYTNLKDILDDQNIKNIKSEISSQFNNKKPLIIFCDDISYSGNQLSSHINSSPDDPGMPGVVHGRRRELNYPLNLNSNIRIFLNIIGLLPEALLNIQSQFSNQINLIIPRKTIKFDQPITVQDLINREATNEGLSAEDFLKLNDCWILKIDRSSLSINLESKFTTENLFDNNNHNSLSLIYPFHKYPDGQSTYSKLCYIRNFDNMITLNVDKFFELYPITQQIFCTKISHNVNLRTLLTELQIYLKIDSSIIDTIIYDILNNNVDSYEWLNKCNNADRSSTFTNTNGSWFKSSDNFEDVTNFNGNCYNPSVIKSFYKDIKFKYNSNINMKCTFDQLVDSKCTFDQIVDNTYHQKYLKYKNKYLSLKNIINKN